MPSRVIRSFCYDPLETRLDVLFVTGRCYSYYEVPPAIYDQMRQAFSKGAFFNARIRHSYRFTVGDVQAVRMRQVR